MRQHVEGLVLKCFPSQNVNVSQRESSAVYLSQKITWPLLYPKFLFNVLYGKLRSKPQLFYTKSCFLLCISKSGSLYKFIGKVLSSTYF